MYVEMKVLTPTGTGTSQELASLGVPQKLTETLPFAKLRRRAVVLFGHFLVRHPDVQR